MDRLCLIGVGTSHGDDAAGWEVANRLRERYSWLEARATPDPLAVTDVPAACPLLVVVDACRGLGSPGTIHRFEWPDSRLAAAGGVSSHGLGLVEALRLAEAMGTLPPRVVVFAIEAESPGAGAALSAPVIAAIPAVVDLVLEEANRLKGSIE